MRASVHELPVMIAEEGTVVREIEWGEMHVGHETYETAFDLAPLLKGLPDDMCQSPHWGYVSKGRMRIRFTGRDDEEVVEAGELYYLPPGHAPVFEAGTEIVEFSPKEAFQRTMEVAVRNFLALQAQAQRV